MIDYSFFYQVLFIEATLLTLVLAFITLHRIDSAFFQRLSKKRTAKISEYIHSLLEKKIDYDEKAFKKKRVWKKELLEVLESFDSKIQGEFWNEVKKKHIFLFLIQKARKKVHSFFWRKRNFSARVFALFPFPEDEESIMRLMNDPEFIVLGPASLAGIRLESERAIHKALYAIANALGYIQFFYRDLLTYNASSAFSKLLEFAKDPLLHKAVLDVLSSSSWPAPIPFLKEDLASSSADIRRLALKTLARNLLPDGVQYFEKALNDADDGVLLAALQGINQYPSSQAIPKLKKLMNHHSWQIRTAAARVLKKMGEEGIQFLNSLQEGPGKEAAKYVMEFT